jgi:hypothetical protein
MKYCDPKPEISGVMASDIAGIIGEAIISAGYRKEKVLWEGDGRVGSNAHDGYYEEMEKSNQNNFNPFLKDLENYLK